MNDELTSIDIVEALETIRSKGYVNFIVLRNLLNSPQKATSLLMFLEQQNIIKVDKKSEEYVVDFNKIDEYERVSINKNKQNNIAKQEKEQKNDSQSSKENHPKMEKGDIFIWIFGIIYIIFILSNAKLFFRELFLTVGGFVVFMGLLLFFAKTGL